MSKDFDDEPPAVTIARLKALQEANGPMGWPAALVLIWITTLVAAVILGCVYLNLVHFYR